MMTAMQAALVLAFGAAEEEGGGPGNPPSGDPSDPSVSVYGAPSKWRVSWTNGDATSYTRIKQTSVGGTFGSASVEGVANPGATSFDTTIETEGAEIEDQQTPGDRRFWFVHYKNGQESSNPVSVDTTTGLL